MREKKTSNVMREMGRKGWRRRLATMTAEERQAVAKKAAVASVEARKAKAASNQNKD